MAGHLPRCWEELPEVLLNQISHNLSSLQDRASAARVAKSWRDALDNPALWRNIRGTMTGKARGSKDNQIIKFLDIHGYPHGNTSGLWSSGSCLPGWGGSEKHYYTVLHASTRYKMPGTRLSPTWKSNSRQHSSCSSFE